MKTFQFSHILHCWHLVSLFWFLQYFTQLAPTLFSVLSDLFCPVLSPLNEDTWFPWLCPSKSISQSCLCLSTCLLSSALQFRSLLTFLSAFLILSANKTIVQWVRDICPSGLGHLPSRSVPSSWPICSFYNLLNQVLNLVFSASLSCPAWGYWQCFQRTFIVCSFFLQSFNFASRISFLPFCV